MNNQQARIEALIADAAHYATDARQVPIDVQAALSAEGYNLNNLDRDLARADIR